MAIIIDIDHEGGNLSEYTSTVEDSGDLSVAAGAALAGTSYGMQLVIDDTTAIYGVYTLGSPDTSGSLRVRFYLDPNTLTMADTNIFAVLYVYNSTPNYILILALSYLTSTGYQIIANTYDDAGTGRYTSYVNLSDAAHYIEILLTRAATTESNDGQLTMWLDGTQVSTRSDLDNNTRFANINSLRLGAVGGIDSGTSGTFYLDELIVNNDGSEIGPVSTGATGTLTATLADATLAATGTVAVDGELAATLANATLAATGTVQVHGTAAISLAAATLAGVGGVQVTGTLTATLADATLAATGTVAALAEITGTLDVTLADATVSASGNVFSLDYLRPTTDTARGVWTTHTGATTGLYDTINEAAPDDDDYIQSETSPVSSPVVFALSVGGDAGLSIGHTMRYRYGKTVIGSGETVNLTVQLRQGYVNESDQGTLIAEWTHDDITEALVTAQQVLTVDQANNISNYGSLFARLVAEVEA